ncbi:hypothetical protein [Synechococcus sp. RSCCF101]|uniref:hypothetical protein n=1 Tax=Synechococcus sp. RSCCF101 TaxID=2511069 RepID=UPI001CDA1A84|nr:hypothetical protein [Synechococcus sp. RSCCF101]
MAPLIFWNGVCDSLYGYAAGLSGSDYFSPQIADVIMTAAGRPHWQIMIAQTAGWLYPLYALSLYPWWVGLRQAGFWWSTAPCLLLAYALLMIGGIQHAGWAFLSVLAQAQSLVGSTDPAFHAMANRLIVEHFIMGDFTAMVAFSLGTLWLAAALLRGDTMFPRWFILVSPLAVLIATGIVGSLLPAPIAGWLIAPFGTWFMLIPTITSCLWLWNGSAPLMTNARKAS